MCVTAASSSFWSLPVFGDQKPSRLDSIFLRHADILSENFHAAVSCFHAHFGHLCFAQTLQFLASRMRMFGQDPVCSSTQPAGSSDAVDPKRRTNIQQSPRAAHQSAGRKCAGGNLLEAGSHDTL